MQVYWRFDGPAGRLEYLFGDHALARLTLCFCGSSLGVLFSLILLGALFAIANFFGVVVWVGLFFVVLTLVVQLPRARRRATLDLLTLAIEKRMPLPPVIKALAADQR